MKKVLFLSVMFFAFAIITSCGKDDEPTDDVPVTYEGIIKDELASCATAGCHEAGSLVGSLANYEDVKVFIAFGRTLGALRHQEGFFPMPKNSDKWSNSRIDRLEDWINDGLPE